MWKVMYRQGMRRRRPGCVTALRPARCHQSPDEGLAHDCAAVRVRRYRLPDLLAVGLTKPDARAEADDLWIAAIECAAAIQKEQRLQHGLVKRIGTLVDDHGRARCARLRMRRTQAL